MGVPAFFRWLSRKYPSIVVHCVEEKKKKVGSLDVPVDATAPNPNEVEFDNLYLDMNGIIHPCCHPEDKPAPETEDEMMVAIFEYIDRIFNIVRPRRLLYMAIDGVAPRAKMNQQRSRRFRSAKESKDKLDEIKRIRAELREKKCELPPLKPDGAHFDSNCITPGTQFMTNLAICLQYYIHDRMNNNPAWKGIKVILSDANVPGEGEHKIMDYIRKQRSSPGHDPNTHHCLYGADADLIMLGLATHEPYFTILREEFKPNQPRPCEICNQYGHNMKECTGAAREKQGEFDELATSNIAMQKEFIFIRINILREYLQRELRIGGLGFKLDFERVVDDWVFMCFFVGNDFLPHLPSLQIREGAIDRLIKLYKDVLPVTKTYLTENGFVDVRSVQLILSELGKAEDEIFRRRRDQEISNKQRQQFKKRKIEDYKAPRFIPEQLAPVPIGSVPSPATNARHDAYKMRTTSLASNHEAAKSMKALLKSSKSLQDDDNASTSTSGSNTPQYSSTDNNRSDGSGPLSSGQFLGQKRTHKEEKDESEDEDEVRLWEDGWKERYYQSKFCVSCKDVEFIQQVVESYAEGLCWVMAYYYQGCPSWKWYYPFHYAPFASDFNHIQQIRDKFEMGTRPFRPLEQLMSVFPAASCKFLPPSWQDLMLDEDSPIIDFYPSNFKIDLNGKKFAWQGVALLPFVDEYRLQDALAPVYNTLDPQEVVRNGLGNDYLFVHKYNRLYAFGRTLYEDSSLEGTPKNNEPVAINPQTSGGVSGFVWINECMSHVLKNKGLITSPLPNFDNIKDSQAICLNFKDPQFHSGFIFESKLLPNVTLPPPTLRPEHAHFGPPGSYRPQIGFAPRGNDRRSSYHTPPVAGRFIRNALSDHPPPPSRSHTYPSSGGPQVASWTPFHERDTSHYSHQDSQGFRGGREYSYDCRPPYFNDRYHPYSRNAPRGSEHQYSHEPSRSSEHQYSHRNSRGQRSHDPRGYRPNDYSNFPRGSGHSQYPPRGGGGGGSGHHRPGSGSNQGQRGHYSSHRY